MLELIVFGVVNYGTPDSVHRYYNSVIGLLKKEDFVFVVCDNFSSMEVRKTMDKLSRELDFFKLIQQENIGYGRGLNSILTYIQFNYRNKRVRLVLSNSDLLFDKYTFKNFNVNTVYIPKINDRRSVFLTKLQKIVLLKLQNDIFSKTYFGFLFRTTIVKSFVIFNSEPWTCHGSVFIIDYLVSDEEFLIFNESTFLYSEELEFGSFVECFGYKWSTIDYSFLHRGSESISKVFSSQKSRNGLYHESFRNWLRRWE